MGQFPAVIIVTIANDISTLVHGRSNVDSAAITRRRCTAGGYDFVPRPALPCAPGELARAKRHNDGREPT